MVLSDRFIKAGDAICDFDRHVPAPYFRKSFTLPKKPEHATVTICGLGFYELWLNGKRLTKGALAPYISNPDHIRYYDTYDVAPYLEAGKNAVTVQLGNGFRNSFGGFVWDFEKAHHRGAPTMAIAIELTADGETAVIEADESWKCAPSPITFDDERMGCRYDARLEIPGVTEADFDDSGWQNAIPEKTPAGEAKICTAEPITVAERLAPVSVTHYDRLPYAYHGQSQDAEPYTETMRDNVYVYDFGVNSAGVTELRLRNTRRGQKVTVRHGECLQGGRFSINTVIFERPESTARYLEYAQTDVYICKGAAEEIFVPRFKYDGFRYAYVEGLTKEQATPDAVTFAVMHSDVKEKATFTSSDKTLDALFQMARRADLANFYYFPTDCPHREKNGWTGDASMSAEHLLLNLTTEKSYAEWLANIRAEQAVNGALPGIVPTGGWGYAWGNGPTWDSVCVNPVYYIYRFTGNTDVIRDNVSMIMRYLTYVMTRRDERGLVAIGLGDWCDPFEADKGYITSPLCFTDSAMVFDIANKAAFLFRAIGRKNEALYAEAVAAEMRETIRRELIDDSLTVAGNCETSQAVALGMGLFHDDEIPAARARLVEIVHRAGDINTCGMIGLRYIFRELVNAGEYDLAYHLITDRKRTGYGYWVDIGETTLVEAFYDYGKTIGGSHNHHFFGDISGLFIEEFAGIVPNPGLTDVSNFRIAPHFVSALDHAAATYKSPVGEVAVSWKREGDDVRLTVTAPAGAKGEIAVCPGYRAESDLAFVPGKTTVYTFRKN